MSRLDCIVFLADALEPGREYRERAGFAALAMRELDPAMRAVLGSSMTYLHGRNVTVAPQTYLAAERFGLSNTSVFPLHLEQIQP